MPRHAGDFVFWFPNRGHVHEFWAVGWNAVQAEWATVETDREVRSQTETSAGMQKHPTQVSHCLTRSLKWEGVTALHAQCTQRTFPTNSFQHESPLLAQCLHFSISGMKVLQVFHSCCQKLSHSTFFLQVSGCIRAVFHSKPGVALVEEAVAEKACMVVMGTRGTGDSRHSLLGSVSNHVLHSAPCPVLVCSEGQPQDSQTIRDKVLVYFWFDGFFVCVCATTGNWLGIMANRAHNIYCFLPKMQTTQSLVLLSLVFHCILQKNYFSLMWSLLWMTSAICLEKQKREECTWKR